MHRLMLLFVFLPAFASSAWGLDMLYPFNTANQQPLIAIYGLPSAGPAEVLAPGRTSAGLRADIASSFSRDEGAEESVLLDGETYRYALSLSHGIGERLEVGMEIPFVVHREGFLDSFIIDFHKAFGLSQGGRRQVPNDQLSYAYERDGRTLVDLNDETESFGDLRLTGAWQLSLREGEEPRALALRASLKLPTGDEDRLSGSGSTDFALWLSGSTSLRGGSVALFGAAGGLLMSDGDVLPDQQRNAVGFGTLGAGWRILPRLALKAQVDGHTSFYKGISLREFRSSAQLALGATFGLTDSLTLDFAVVEDIVVDSSPDVVFHLALRQVF